MQGIPFLYKAFLLAKSARSSIFDQSMLTLFLALVFIFILVLVLVFLRKRIIPVIRLASLRILYGQYSFEYLEFFKKHDLRNPLNNCIKDEITLHFSVFFRKFKNAVDFTTTVPIGFKDIPFMTLYQKVVKQFGQPSCINIARFGTSRVKVIGYSESFHQKKMKSLFYFIDDRFVMGEFVFSEYSRMNPTPVKEALSQKFLNGKPLEPDVFYISDSNGNRINFYDNGFYASVKYLFLGDTAINEILNTLFSPGQENGQAYRNAMIQEELLNRF
jgi:hypothetical protein